MPVGLTTSIVPSCTDDGPAGDVLGGCCAFAVLQIVANNAGNAVKVSHAVRRIDSGNELVFALSMAPLNLHATLRLRPVRP
jgi:hypothetical protein